MKDYEKTEYWKVVQEFIKELETSTYWFSPDGEPCPEWKFYEGDTWEAAREAARNAALDTALDAVRDTAWDAALDVARDIAWEAARNAAWKAARNAARNAARDIAWEAARDIAWEAAWEAAACDAACDVARGTATCDAALFARMIVCLDLNIDMKHLTHLNKRMEVWRKGYALLCDVNGVLYVYAKKFNN